MFGVVPGTKYGWPKNVLHWKGIHRSILDICATAPMHFVIADGVVAMEGNGPLHGTHRHLGKIVLADDPVAADFTCARLMGLDPHRVWHLDRAAQFLGNGSHDRIDLIAEGLPRGRFPLMCCRNSLVFKCECEHAEDSGDGGISRPLCNVLRRYNGPRQFRIAPRIFFRLAGFNKGPDVNSDRLRTFSGYASSSDEAIPG